MFNFKSMSRIRKLYFARLFARIGILLLSLALYFVGADVFAPLEGMRFFEGVGLMHLLWLIWMIDMFAQIFPFHKDISIGSLKVFARHFRPIRDKINPKAIKEHIVAATKATFWVIVIWCLLTAVIGLAHAYGLLSDIHLFLITVFFYVCDLICVLIWCPFRLTMKNRCCTTCRIFNWDHLMMFSPMLFIPSFYALSLFFVSLLVFFVWEIAILLHPERFWDKTNAALQCVNCTDKLCTQYCQKLRK